MAEREGLFTREGLNVKVVIPIPGGSDKMIDALNDDWADVTHIATPYLIRSALAGSDAVAIASEFRNPIYSLIAKPEIQTFADLTGKVIGFADESGTISISMRRLLTMHGLNRGDFIAKVEEGTPARLSCLRRGVCDAVVLGQPQDLQAIADGYRLLGRSDEVVSNFLYTVTAARRSWAASHKDTLVPYLRAMASAFASIRDPSNRNRVVKIIAETSGSSEIVAAQTLDLILQHDALPNRGEISIAGLNEVIAMMSGAGLLKPPPPQAQNFIDLQYLRAAGIQQVN
ncbi:MAG: ABC transporter substrate-binding protein [Bradyrhizobiaceae bacterium]|nr:ABC transporter substrate-binding protein [Bradyrhizobiaceae bacterium]